MGDYAWGENTRIYAKEKGRKGKKEKDTQRRFVSGDEYKNCRIFFKKREIDKDDKDCRSRWISWRKELYGVNEVGDSINAVQIAVGITALLLLFRNERDSR